MKFFLAIILSVLGQVLAFYQLQGHLKYEWLKNNIWVAVLMGIPISIIFMTSINLMIKHFDGQLWPSRIFGFTIGTITYALMSKILFEESINTKTMVCLFLSFLIILVQVFWKD
jgi:multidrug transporter EmrE-like cation transporter